MPITNLTQNEVAVLDRHGHPVVTFYPADDPLRVLRRTRPDAVVDGVEIISTSLSLSRGLPEPEEGRLFIVGRLVKVAVERMFPERSAEFIVPEGIIRSGSGQILGCQRMSR